jgi:hypothetical protein
MALLRNPLRQRAAMVFVVVGIVLIVQQVVAQSQDDAAAPAEPLGGSAAFRAAPVGVDAARGDLPVDPRAERAHQTQAPTQLQLDRLTGRLDDASAARAPLFGRPVAAVTQTPPAPPPPPAPRPVAPSFPYPYIGGLTDADQRTAFFTQGERVLAVRAGDTVDGAYRIEQLSPNQMSLTYLPLQQPMKVMLGDRP